MEPIGKPQLTKHILLEVTTRHEYLIINHYYLDYPHIVSHILMTHTHTP